MFASKQPFLGLSEHYTSPRGCDSIRDSGNCRNYTHRSSDRFILSEVAGKLFGRGGYICFHLLFPAFDSFQSFQLRDHGDVRGLCGGSNGFCI